MNLYAVSSITGCLMNLAIGFWAYSKNKKKLVNISFFILNIVLSTWIFGCFLQTITTEKSQAVFFDKIIYTGVILYPISFLYFIYNILKLDIKKDRYLFLVISISSLAFLFLNYFSPLRPYFISDVSKKYPFRFIASAGPLWFALTLCGFIIISYGLFLIIRSYRTNKGLKSTQIKYLLIAYFILTIAGFMYFGLVINIYTPPFDNFLVVVFSYITAYAFIRYRLMDVTLAFTRTGIFIAVYSLVLSIPFFAAYTLRPLLKRFLGDNWWIGPLVLSTFLATAGPFIYLYIQRRAEDRLLREQRRYQQTLRRASAGMTRIRNLKKLLNLIVHVVTRTVHLKHSSIYLHDTKEDKFFLQAFRDQRKPSLRQSPYAGIAQGDSEGRPYSRPLGRDLGAIEESKPPYAVEASSTLIRALRHDKVPIVYEEVKQRAQDFNDIILSNMQKELEALDAAVVVPSLVEEGLIGFLVLGEKISGRLYSQDDLAVFSVLANQSALAIENAQFYEDIKETQTQLFQAEKMATIGTMADGLSHQINNRFHALGMIAADTLDALNSLKENSAPEEIQETFKQVRFALDRIKENVKQGGEVVHGLLKYSRPGESGFAPVDLDSIINASLEMAQYKIKLSQIDIIRDYTKDTPKINGNMVQLQEVFFNLIDNAYDAIMQRKNELKEPEYRGSVTIQAQASSDSALQIRVIDTGMGVKDADQERLFTPFFTTKASSKKGTGLGLYVIQKIVVDNHHGKIHVESEFGTGTLFTIELPTTKQ